MTIRQAIIRTVACPQPVKRNLATSAAQGTLSRTPLFSLHQAQAAKFAPFAGYEMPLYYAKGGAEEHKHTRSHASIFDVSHMVQSKLEGNGATEFLSWLTPSSVSGLQHSENKFCSTLSVLLNEQGGILDDLMITRQGDGQFYLVTNAGRREEDLQWIERQLKDWNAKYGKTVTFRTEPDLALLALQGPKAAAVLQEHTSSDLSKLLFGQSAFLSIDNQDMHVARSGYTGEDGFEISLPATQSISFAEKLLSSASSDVVLAGLAARDSLRIEAGLCLYGHDITDTITPVEAGLTWVIGKDRRVKDAFIGANPVLEQLEKGRGPLKRRVGFTIQGAPAREGAKVYDAETEEEVGVITSGIPSPTLGQNIAMGYIKTGHHKKDTPVKVEVRKKKRDAMVTKMPFVPAKYFRGLA